MSNSHTVFGDIIKNARKRNAMTISELAEVVGVSERYIGQIENEGQLPGFQVTYNLIRALHIPADAIFYPEKPTEDSDIVDLFRMLADCSEESIELTKAFLRILIERDRQK